MVQSDSYTQGIKNPMWRRGGSPKTRSRKNSFPWSTRREIAANWTRSPEPRRLLDDTQENDN